MKQDTHQLCSMLKRRPRSHTPEIRLLGCSSLHFLSTEQMLQQLKKQQTHHFQGTQIIINLGIEEKAFVELVQLWLPTIRHASFQLSHPHLLPLLPPYGLLLAFRAFC